MIHFRITKKYLFIFPLLVAFSIGVLPLCPTEAAAPKADMKKMSKATDPAFAIPMVSNPIEPQAMKEMEIVEKQNRWLVSASSLERYGIHKVMNRPGYFLFRLPEPAAAQSLGWQHPTVELLLPGTDSSQGYEVSIRKIRRPLGLSYELLPDGRKELQPPLQPVRGIRELQQQRFSPAGDIHAKNDAVIIWDPVVKDDEDIPEIKSKQPAISMTSFSLSKDGVVLKNPNFDKLLESYQQKGYVLWPLVDNDFDPDLTHAILMDKALQAKIIKELMGYAILYGFNGYNIDFENIHVADKDRLTSFVKDIAVAAKAYGLTTSMDVTAYSDNSNWSLVYDRKALGGAVDYLALMAYDQFSRGSRTAGPVASYPWVEQAVQHLTKDVDSRKIILGMPLYMRIWYEAYNDRRLSKLPAQWKLALASGAHPDQVVRLDIRTLSMADSQTILKQYERYVRWDNVLRLYYLELPLEDGIVKIWFEDEKSLKEKAGIMRQYNLAGAAFWRKGFETSNLWQDFGKHELT